MEGTPFRYLGICFFVVFLFVLSGCSERAWFQGFIEGQKHQCNKLDGRERSNCLESINTDWVRYQQERQEHLRQAE